MDFGLMFFASTAAPSRGGTYGLLTEAARFADQNGFRSVWTPESLAMITRRIEICAGSLISHEDGTVVLVCNGEIFNYRELRTRSSAAIPDAGSTTWENGMRSHSMWRPRSRRSSGSASGETAARGVEVALCTARFPAASAPGDRPFADRPYVQYVP